MTAPPPLCVHDLTFVDGLEEDYCYLAAHVMLCPSAISILFVVFVFSKPTMEWREQEGGSRPGDGRFGPLTSLSAPPLCL